MISIYNKKNKIFYSIKKFNLIEISLINKSKYYIEI